MKFQTIFYFVASSLAKQFCFGQDYCLLGSTTDGVTTFTVHSANDGWAGMGQGTEMKGAKIIVGSKDSNGNIQIGDFIGQGHRLPTPTTKRATLIPLVGTPPTWAKLSFSFTIPAVEASAPYIWATSNQAPTSLTEFKVHDLDGTFEADFTGQTSSADKLKSTFWVIPALFFTLF